MKQPSSRRVPLPFVAGLLPAIFSFGLATVIFAFVLGLTLVVIKDFAFVLSLALFFVVFALALAKGSYVHRRCSTSAASSWHREIGVPGLHL